MEELVELQHLRNKIKNMDAEIREHHRDVEKVRSHNDYFYFLMKLMKEEDKSNFFIAMDADKHYQEYFKDRQILIDSQAQRQLREKVIEMIQKQKDHEKAFRRTKEERREIVNFKDCRPKALKDKMILPQEGDRAFVKHVGEVQFIENGSLKVNIVKNQKDEITKDKYQLKAIAELQESSLKSLVGEVEDKYEKQKIAKQNIIDKLYQMKEQLAQMIPEKQQQIQVSMNEAEQETQMISSRVHNLMKMRDQIRRENMQLKDELAFQEKNQADSVRLFCDELKKKSYEMIFIQKKIADKNKKKLKEMLTYSETNNKKHEEFNDNLKLQLDTTKQHRGEINEKIVGSRKTVRELMEEYLEELKFYADSKRTLEYLIDKQDLDQIRRVLRHRKFSNYRIKEFRENLELLQSEIVEGVEDTAKTFRKEYLSIIPDKVGIEYQTASTLASTARNKEELKKGSTFKSSKISSLKKSSRLEFK